MEIEVTSVDKSDPPLIQFRCVAGTGTAVWTGEEIRPGTTRHVEMDHATPLRWIGEGTLTDGSIDGCCLVGKVEAILDDGLVAVRIDAGVLLTELVSGLPLPKVGSRIELRDVQLTVSPVNL